MKKSLLFFAAFTSCFLCGQAMDIKLISGDLAPLKGEKALKVEYTYTNITVGEMKEEDFVAKKVAEANKKTEGRGDRWKKEWYSDRAGTYQPKFEDLMNKILQDRKAALRISPDAKDTKYTLILRTVFIEPGFNVWIARGNAYINADIDIVETANPTTVIARLWVRKSPGRTAMGDDYDTGGRVGEAYAKCGKELANFIYKKALK